MKTSSPGLDERSVQRLTGLWQASLETPSLIPASAATPAARWFRDFRTPSTFTSPLTNWLSWR